MEREKKIRFLKKLADAGGQSMIDVSRDISQKELNQLKTEGYLMTNGKKGMGDELEVILLQKGYRLVGS